MTDERITTEAGRRLLALLASQRVSQDDSWKNGCLYAEECFRNSLAAIEAEAVAAYLASPEFVERLDAAISEGLDAMDDEWLVSELAAVVSTRLARSASMSGTAMSIRPPSTPSGSPPMTSTTDVRGPSYPYGETDAMKWAEEFDRLFSGRSGPDTGTMLSWFANAIETGRDAGLATLAAERARAEAVIDLIKVADTGGGVIHLAVTPTLRAALAILGEPSDD